MKMLFSREKGSILVITLNIIIILTIFLLSFSFTSITRYRVLTGEIMKYQAYLNARSGIAMALKELREKKFQIPFNKEFFLFDDKNCKAEVTLDYIIYRKDKRKIEIYTVKKSSIIRIISIGRYKDVNCKITMFMEGGHQLFYHSQ